jgi:hypothetical protein
VSLRENLDGIPRTSTIGEISLSLPFSQHNFALQLRIMVEARTHYPFELDELGFCKDCEPMISRCLTHDSSKRPWIHLFRIIPLVRQGFNLPRGFIKLFQVVCVFIDFCEIFYDRLVTEFLHTIGNPRNFCFLFFVFGCLYYFAAFFFFLHAQLCFEACIMHAALCTQKLRSPETKNPQNNPKTSISSHWE